MFHTMSAQAQSELLGTLESALVERDVQAGFALLDTAISEAPLDCLQPKAIPLLFCVAQFADLGYRDLAFFDRISSGSAQISILELPLLDVLRLHLIKGYRLLAGEQADKAIDLLDLVLRSGGDVLPPYLAFVTHFWKGRAHRKRGDYEHAVGHITRARQIAEEMRAPKLSAVAKIHESWLAFQRGERRYAFAVLDEAEQILRPTGHALSLGNIESARGRFVRRSGEYARALRHFETAIALYRTRFPEHPNLARALVNAAYVKRLIALDLMPRRGAAATGATHARSLAIARDALALLEEAGRIYAHHQHQGGTGSVLVNSAHIHLESGDVYQASVEGERAFALGEQKADLILMARARIVLSGVELAQAEEQAGESSDVALYANLAVEHAEEAVHLALKTQNKRLLAEAYIARGFAAGADFFEDWETAKRFSNQATALLNPDDRDHLMRTLSELKLRLLKATRIDETLRLWSDGQFGDKTFQQIQEEFAEFVIPKIWLRCGRNVSQVAKKLSISPKKVRRLLKNAKLEEAPKSRTAIREKKDVAGKDSP